MFLMGLDVSSMIIKSLFASLSFVFKVLWPVWLVLLVVFIYKIVRKFLRKV